MANYVANDYWRIHYSLDWNIIYGNIINRGQSLYELHIAIIEYHFEMQYIGIARMCGRWHRNKVDGI